MTPNQSTYVGVYQPRRLGDDVEIKATVTMGFKCLNAIGNLGAGPTRTPNTLYLVNDDHRAVRHQCRPLERVSQFLMRYLEVRDTRGIDDTIFAELREQIYQRGTLT